MAKIRVYELARDLNMKNKALLNKLDELKIPVRSHMSSLEDETVEKIKMNILGKKEDSVEVTRVKPTVIRRRKKRSRPKAVPVDVEPTEKTVPEADLTEEEGEPEASEEEVISETEADVQPVEQAHADEKEIEAVDDVEHVTEEEPDTLKAEEKTSVSEEPAAETAQPETVDEDSVPVTDETTRQADLKAQKTEPPGEKEVEPEPEESRESEAVVSIDQQEQEKAQEPVQAEKIAAAEEPVVEEKAEKPEEMGKAEEHPEEKEKVEKPKKAEKVEEPEQPEKIEKPKPEVKRTKAQKKRKKQKKETPAKIIKLPVQKEKPETDRTPKPEADSVEKPVSKPADDSGKDDRAPETEETPVVDDLQSADRKKKKVKRRHGDGEEEDAAAKDKRNKDIRWSKKKISFKRKEVIEGEDLYPKGHRGRKGKKAKSMQLQKPVITVPKAIKRRIKIDETIVLSDLAKRMGIKANEIIAKLMTMGVMITVNQTIDFDTAALVASEFEYELEKASFEEKEILKVQKDDPEKMEKRPPVVTIMGHVDHGKTSLLDVIRKTRITEEEAGGITQHIGAYSVSTDSGLVTFLDTPGHEAFTSMRARGAKVTDIVVLVVAADDGVMPQTIEAINHSNAAGVPIIVAINKIDKANADTDRVTRELAEQGLVPEAWGGDTIFVRISAKMNTGIDDLLEMILLQAELLELKANPNKLAAGYVVEAKLDSGRGPVATILVQDGTLRAGDAVVCGIHHGKIRALLNDRMATVESAGPSIPVEVLGLSGVPNAGDELVTLETEKSARQVSTHRVQKQRSIDLAKTSRMSLDKLFEKMKEGEVKELNLIIKADVQGSIEALSDSLVKLSNEEVEIHIVHSATGTITESDVSLAAVSDAIIIGFNVRPSTKVQSLANEEHVDMRFYSIIYNVIKEVKDAIVGMMESRFEERILGKVEVRDTFHVPKVGTIAGCYVLEGKVERGRKVRLIRDGVIVFDGKISSLRRFKDDAKEVMAGYECGIGLENFQDIKVGDMIECYYLEEFRPEL